MGGNAEDKRGTGGPCSGSNEKVGHRPGESVRCARRGWVALKNEDVVKDGRVEQS